MRKTRQQKKIEVLAIKFTLNVQVSNFNYVVILTKEKNLQNH